jgi:hypothetical protein
MDLMTGLVSGAGTILAVVVLSFLLSCVWGVGRWAYFSVAAKIMGWSEHEKFMRETAWLHRESARNTRQQEKDAKADSADRRRMGAYFVAFAVTWLALSMQLPWWATAMVAIATYLGLHMVGGVTIKWSW